MDKTNAHHSLTPLVGTLFFERLFYGEPSCNACLLAIENHFMKRRDFIRQSTATAVSATFSAAFASTLFTRQAASQETSEGWSFKYLLGSCMYGYLYLGEILPEVRKTGATAIDIWPKVHGNQREQLDDLGEEKFRAMLAQHQIELGCITQYKLGPFGLQDEMRLAERFGCKTIVTGGSGPKGLEGAELKSAVGTFVERMKPHLEVAAETGVTIAIENHANNLIESAESLKWLAELSGDLPLAIALAPYHLPQDAIGLAELIRALGDKINVFYAWQHGMGCMTRLPKEQELLQMPGRGDLDFAPLVSALQEIQFDGWTEIFMHPVPRGIPILETAAEVTAEINLGRKYLEDLLVVKIP
jgi:sugar phosphate isomerase/epimerase